MDSSTFTLNSLGETVRKQGYAAETGGTCKQLLYDTVSGEFRTVEPDTVVTPRDGEIVTEMTETGFAWSSHI